MTKLKYGIMGGASIVPRFVTALKQSDESLAQALATRDIMKTQKLAEELDIPVVHATYEDLVADPELDVIYIPLWNKGHFEGAKLAIEAGKNVLLEKPFTLKTSEAKALFALAHKHNVFLMEAQKAVFLPVIQKVKAAIDSGKIGKIEWVDAQQSHPGVEEIPWFEEATAGGGAYIGSASYPLSVLQYLFGTGFDSVNGYLTHLKGKSDTKGQVIVTKGNLMMSSLITTSFQLESRMVIYGTKGKITIPDYWKTDRAIIETEWQTQKIDLPHDSEFVFEIAHVAACLKNGNLTSPIMTPELTIATGKVVETLYQESFGQDYLC
ncbi:Gfo/Idh/MocA family protein [Lactococcus hodotermopsidis]|nr:Gfo/Idh/MocA family oxidoreductase [Lactococcus hodotermopsidis]